MPNTITIGEKEYTFKRPILNRSIKAYQMGLEKELFKPLPDIDTIALKEPERYEQFKKDWREFCELVFEGEIGEELNLENVVYPDDVTEVQSRFFTLRWEKTTARWKEFKDVSKSLPSPEET